MQANYISSSLYSFIHATKVNHFSRLLIETHTHTHTEVHKKQWFCFCLFVIDMNTQ